MGKTAANFALINKIGINQPKKAKSIRLDVKDKHLKAGWDNDNMLKILIID